MAVFFTVLFGGVLAASAGAWISRSTKISEFRQAWIDNLTKDISEFVGVAERWFRKFDEINGIPDAEKILRKRDELFPIADEARVILRRIRLRFNPRSNQYKTEDDALLKHLADLLNPDLLNPDRLGPDNPEFRWHTLADQAVEHAREVLKREWEVTKRPRLPLCDAIRKCLG